MKAKLRVSAVRMSTWPVIGRFVRIAIAVIRLPDERVQFRQLIVEQSLRLQNEVNALAAANERLARHEFFIASQLPRLAQKMAELNQAHQVSPKI